MGTKIVLQHNPSEADIRPPLAFMSTRLSRKIYISEARLQALRVRRQRLDQLCTPLRYLVATVATLTAISASRWPGGQSHLSSRKIYELCSMKGTARGQCCRLSAKHSISFAFHFAISCSGHRGHPGHRVFFGAVSHSAVPLRRDRLCTTKATHELQEFPVYTPQGCKGPFLCHALVARTRRAQLKVENGRLYMTKPTRKLQ